MEAFSLKLWWRFRERSSLWAEYMHRKYWSHSAAFCIYRSRRFRPTWRRLFKVGSKCQSLFRWMLGKGNINLWDDVWVKDKPLSSFCLREEAPEFVWVKNLWRDSEWDEEAILARLEEHGIPRHLVEDILLIPFDPEEEDKARWILTPHGNFTLASAWEQVRARNEEREVFKIIWNKSINPTISVFLWRLLANRLPVDEKVQWRGVSLASKCRCCDSPKIESRLHLFVNGEAAMGVWDYLHLRNLDLAGHLGPEQWKGCVPGMALSRGRSDRRRVKKVELVQWKPPDPPWLKLNSDGAFESSRNKAGGGGLLRNCQGELVEAFSTPLEVSSGLEAEMRALWEGILMAKRFGRHLWMETDAEILCSILEKGQLGLAEMRHIMANIRTTLKGLTWRITHIRREGNKAADFLASLGKEGSNLIRYTGRSAPPRVKALVRLDQIGMPNFRFS